MSSGVKGAIRVSIPSNVKEMIENIKEITGPNHTEDEIYAVLKECSMDPNETTQKLLLLDTFHEVKSKRDRRKENLNKEPTELRWKTGTQARANKGARGNYSSRYTSRDADGGKSLAALKEIATDHLTTKGVSKDPLATQPEMKKNETISVTSPITDVSNGPSSITSQSKQEVNTSASGSVNQSKATVNASICKLEAPLPISSPIDSIRKARAPEIGEIHQQQILGVINSSPTASASAPGSSSDSVLFPSQDLPLQTAVGSSSRELGSPQTHSEVVANNSTINFVSAGTSDSESGSSNTQQKIPNELHVVGKNQHVEFLQIGSSTTGVFSVNRPSSNYNNRSQMIGPQKVGGGKEWKPKSTSSSSVVGQVSATAFVSEVSMNRPESQPKPIVIGSKEATLDLQTKLEDSHISDVQHVIIPNHLHVPETEKLGFCFGSFDANFNLDKSHNGGPESDETQPLSESYEAIDESMKELPLSNQNAVTVVKDSEIKYLDEHQPPSQGPENFSSSEVEVPASIIPDYSKSKQEVAPGSHQHHAVHTSSNYNFGFIPPVLAGQVSSLESSDAQARDAPRLPGIAVQQPLDPTSYYSQFYRSSIDGDGRISPFNPAVTNKYIGGAALVSVQTSQSPQEGGVPFILSNSSTPLVTQAGVIQNSVPATQQPLPVFRQPTGVHMPHYPPNYIPYGPYFSPFYVPPQAILQFLSNGAFPQQPQAGNMYPTPPGTTAKYSVSQYKQGSNTGSSTQIGMPGSFGPYDNTMANYTSSSATAAVSSTANEDLPASQIKENIYASGQQGEGSGVWFTTPSRDISNLQASSFYNLPQGQLAFTPTQPGPGTFTSIFHPAQAVTAATVHPLLQQSQSITTPADIVGPTAHVYQQPQPTQLNWPTNY